MSESAAPPLTPEQEARVQELVRAMLPELIQTVLVSISQRLRLVLPGRTVEDFDGNVTHFPPS